MGWSKVQSYSYYKEWNDATFNDMDRSRGCLNEWSKSDRKGEISYGFPCIWNLKRNNINELIVAVGEGVGWRDS